MSATHDPDDPASARAPVDPDIDLHVPGQRVEWSRHRFVLPAIALGGMAGAGARHAAAERWPTATDGMPWTTLGVNAVGCLLIGVLMVVVMEVGGTHPLLRPFVGVGVLGGFTTFSTYAVDTVSLVDAGRPAVALGYGAGTLLVALVAVAAGVLVARAAVRVAARAGERPA
ncbi:MAG TPA: fluoride efflux transporter CrcB [Nocardioides sp.]|nr:fluoride efflux transporter CrcB [Nocardioides sp.]